MMPLRVDWLQADGAPLFDAPGQIALSSCPGVPGGAAQLALDVERILSLGIGTVLSLVDDGEMDYYNAGPVAEALAAAGLRHLRFPIIDGLPPPQVGPARELCGRLLGLLGEGERVLIHCIGGWGRSGTIAAALLIHEGLGPNRAIAAVREARSPRCVESWQQEKFLLEYGLRQERFERRYHIARRAELRGRLSGEAGARRYRPGAGLPIGRQELSMALDRLGAEEHVVLSGEMAAGAAPPAPHTEQVIDRAHVFRQRALVPVPLPQVMEG